jgi:hypothetical protein
MTSDTCRKIPITLNPLSLRRTDGANLRYGLVSPVISYCTLQRIFQSPFLNYGLKFEPVNIRDDRTIGEQVKSGFRITGLLLLALGFMFIVFGSTTLFLGKGNFIGPIYRVLGACGLATTSTVMFFTVRHWVKWFIGALGYLALKAAFAFLLGFTPSAPSIVRPRLLILEFVMLAVIAIVLCAQYLSHAPRKIEKAGLVGLVFAISFATAWDSTIPLLVGVAILAFIQLAHRPAHRKALRTTELIE